MPNFVIVPASNPLGNFANAIHAYGVASPADVTLPNDTEYRAYEIVLSPPSANFTPTAAPPDPRTTDADALYWFAADSVQRSGSTITTWDDKISGGTNLAQISTAPLPTYDETGDFVSFTGAEIIGNTAFPFAQSAMSALSGGGEATIWAVCRPDPTSAAAWFTLVREGLGGSAPGNNFCMQLLGVNVGNYGYEARNRNASPAFTTTTALDAANNNALVLVELRVDQDNAALDVNDGAFSATTEVTPANFAASGDGLTIGAADDSGTPAIGFAGEIYDIYASSTTNATLKAAIRAAMMAQYGIS